MGSTALRNLKTWLAIAGLLCTLAGQAIARERDVQVQLDGFCNVFTFHFGDNNFDKSLLGFEERDACEGTGKAYGLGVVSKLHKQRVLVASQTSSGSGLLELFIFSYPLSTGGTFTYYATENGIEIDGKVTGTYTVLP